MLPKIARNYATCQITENELLIRHEVCFDSVNLLLSILYGVAVSLN